jgi:hypothetical protein
MVYRGEGGISQMIILDDSSKHDSCFIPIPIILWRNKQANNEERKKS